MKKITVETKRILKSRILTWTVVLLTFGLTSFKILYPADCSGKDLKEAVGKWEFIPEQSLIKFKIQNMWWGSGEGIMGGLNGTADIKQDISNSNVELKLEVKTINTESGKRDKHLKSDDFFAEEKYPLVKFNSANISSTSNGTFKYVLKGNLTIKDVTKEMSVPFNLISIENGIASFTGETKVNRKTFHVDYGGMGMGDEATVLFTIKAKKSN